MRANERRPAQEPGGDESRAGDRNSISPATNNVPLTAPPTVARVPVEVRRERGRLVANVTDEPGTLAVTERGWQHADGTCLVCCQTFRDVDAVREHARTRQHRVKLRVWGEAYLEPGQASWATS